MGTCPNSFHEMLCEDDVISKFVGVASACMCVFYHSGMGGDVHLQGPPDDRCAIHRWSYLY